MPAELAKYSVSSLVNNDSFSHLANKGQCDECRTRKIGCSREAPGCTQCKNDARKCVYSRAGIIRRRPRQSKKSFTSTSHSNPVSTVESEALVSTGGHLQSQMDYDITEMQDNLRRFGDSEASGTLATLDEEYSSFWQGPSLRDMAKELAFEEKKFVTFSEEQAALFTASYENVARKGRPLYTAILSETLQLIFRNPEQVQERAHLVMVYGILLTEACLDDSFDQITATKLRWNLRLSLDDAKLLLEPSDLNIQALTLLACHVQEVSTPSLCWMMVSTACRMLQVLGINSRSLDVETRERRLMLFWFLSPLDSSLALVFGRPPNLHRAMIVNTPLIPMQKLLDWQPHLSSCNTTSQFFKSMFGPHIMHRMHLSAGVLSEVWSCIFEDGSKFDKVKRKLDDWYQESVSILQACLLSEKPFLDVAAQKSMQLGIQSMKFQYNYLRVLLIRSRPTLKEDCLSTSREALFILTDLVSDSSEVYNGVIWQLLFSPFTPFFILFGEILSKGPCQSSHQSLIAMEAMVKFMAQMKSRHPQAPKMHTIAATFLKYAKAAISEKNGKTRVTTNTQEMEKTTSGSLNLNFPETADNAIRWQGPDLLEPNFHNSQPLQDLFNDPVMQNLSLDMDFWMPNTQTSDLYQAHSSGFNELPQTNAPTTDAYGFFADSTFDWFSWDPNPNKMLGLWV